MKKQRSSFAPLHENYRDDKVLYKLVVDKNWHRVVRHCRQKEPRADRTSPRRRLAPGEVEKDSMLYIACLNRPPVQAVTALLEAYPDMAMAKTQDGDLALHAATRRNASLGVLKTLVSKHPAAACSFSASKTKKRKTPVRCLWDARVTTESDQVQENYNTVFWQKMQVLLEAVAKYRFQTQQKGKGRTEKRQNYRRSLLQAAVFVTRLDGPEQLVDYALDKYPEQVSIRDPSGRLPLHVAVGPFASRRSSNHQRHWRLSTRDSVIGQLLEVYPDAAGAKDPNERAGRYPLHTALLHQHTWYGGVKELFENAPEALYYVDSATGLYAFQMAAVQRETDVDLDSIYCLLRAEPGVLDDKVFCCGSWLELSANVQETVTFYESIVDLSSDQPAVALPSPVKSSALSTTPVPGTGMKSPPAISQVGGSKFSSGAISHPRPPSSAFPKSPSAASAAQPVPSPSSRSFPVSAPISTSPRKQKNRLSTVKPPFSPASQSASPSVNVTKKNKELVATPSPTWEPPLAVVRDPDSFYERITSGSVSSKNGKTQANNADDEVDTDSRLKPVPRSKSGTSVIRETITLFEDGNASIRDLSDVFGDESNSRDVQESFNASSGSILAAISFFEENSSSKVNLPATPVKESEKASEKKDPVRARKASGATRDERDMHGSSTSIVDAIAFFDRDDASVSKKSTRSRQDSFHDSVGSIQSSIAFFEESSTSLVDNLPPAFQTISKRASAAMERVSASERKATGSLVDGADVASSNHSQKGPSPVIGTALETTQARPALSNLLPKSPLRRKGGPTRNSLETSEGKPHPRNALAVDSNRCVPQHDARASSTGPHSNSPAVSRYLTENLTKPTAEAGHPDEEKSLNAGGNDRTDDAAIAIIGDNNEAELLKKGRLDAVSESAPEKAFETPLPNESSVREPLTGDRSVDRTSKQDQPHDEHVIFSIGEPSASSQRDIAINDIKPAGTASLALSPDCPLEKVASAEIKADTWANDGKYPKADKDEMPEAVSSTVPSSSSVDDSGKAVPAEIVEDPKVDKEEMIEVVSSPALSSSPADDDAKAVPAEIVEEPKTDKDEIAAVVSSPTLSLSSVDVGKAVPADIVKTPITDKVEMPVLSSPSVDGGKAIPTETVEEPKANKHEMSEMVSSTGLSPSSVEKGRAATAEMVEDPKTDKDGMPDAVSSPVLSSSSVDDGKVILAETTEITAEIANVAPSVPDDASDSPEIATVDGHKSNKCDEAAASVDTDIPSEGTGTNKRANVSHEAVRSPREQGGSAAPTGGVDNSADSRITEMILCSNAETTQDGELQSIEYLQNSSDGACDVSPGDHGTSIIDGATHDKDGSQQGYDITNAATEERLLSGKIGSAETKELNIADEPASPVSASLDELGSNQLVVSSTEPCDATESATAEVSPKHSVACEETSGLVVASHEEDVSTQEISDTAIPGDKPTLSVDSNKIETITTTSACAEESPDGLEISTAEEPEPNHGQEIFAGTDLTSEDVAASQKELDSRGIDDTSDDLRAEVAPEDSEETADFAKGQTRGSSSKTIEEVSKCNEVTSADKPVSSKYMRTADDVAEDIRVSEHPATMEEPMPNDGESLSSDSIGKLVRLTNSQASTISSSRTDGEGSKDNQTLSVEEPDAGKCVGTTSDIDVPSAHLEETVAAVAPCGTDALSSEVLADNNQVMEESIISSSVAMIRAKADVAESSSLTEHAEGEMTEGGEFGVNDDQRNPTGKETATVFVESMPRPDDTETTNANTGMACAVMRRPDGEEVKSEDSRDNNRTGGDVPFEKKERNAIKTTSPSQGSFQNTAEPAKNEASLNASADDVATEKVAIVGELSSEELQKNKEALEPNMTERSPDKAGETKDNAISSKSIQKAGDPANAKIDGADAVSKIAEEDSNESSGVYESSARLETSRRIYVHEAEDSTRVETTNRGAAGLPSPTKARKLEGKNMRPKRVKQKISAQDVLRRRETLEMQKQVDLKRRRLRSHQMQGERRGLRHKRRRDFMEQSLDQARSSSRKAVLNLHERNLEGKRYKDAIAEATADVSKKESETPSEEEVKALELQAELVRQMHLMLAADRQLSLLKKQNREIKKYLQKCKAWLLDSDTVEDGLTRVESTMVTMKFLYEDTCKRQNDAIAKFISRPQDFMAAAGNGGTKNEPAGTSAWGFIRGKGTPGG